LTRAVAAAESTRTGGANAEAKNFPLMRVFDDGSRVNGCKKQSFGIAALTAVSKKGDA
jgi:hypothetical protein